MLRLMLRLALRLPGGFASSFPHTKNKTKTSELAQQWGVIFGQNRHHRRYVFLLFSPTRKSQGDNQEPITASRKRPRTSGARTSLPASVGLHPLPCRRKRSFWLALWLPASPPPPPWCSRYPWIETTKTKIECGRGREGWAIILF